MKFFAPRNNWDMKDPNGWWPLIGSVQSASGVRVTEETAQTLSAFFCGVRVISETLASLPLCIMEREDYRTSKKAVGHPLWPILHDTPTPEQDSMSWIDMQSALQIGWGNAYAEIQRDSTGEIKALWPIHPSRIPERNITRNGRNPSTWQRIEAGQPGEIVYNVANDDGTRTPIPASDMLHVPGVLSSNGVTGTSIVMRGANAIGIAIATETHAGAYFKNGAVSNMAIKSPKVVGKETADRLREQWQRVFGGAHNHYKTLLLEDGMEAVPFSINPEASQLLASRQFSVTEIARLLRIPPHLLADLSRATFSNVEAENLSFIVHCMLPWIVRWEKALFRQLLTAEEKKRYIFKFNVMGLLRGDSAARAQFYKALFDMGALSPNDIREREDMNPIDDGGDQYFVPGNNLVPLDKINEMADAQIQKLTAPPPAPVTPNQGADDDDEPDAKQLRLVELRKLQEEFIAKVELRDTQDAERLAVRQQKVIESEDALRDALRCAIASRLAGLTEYECRAVRQATRKPETFLTWQADFYTELTAKISAALQPFEEPADRLGFTFDAEWIATVYVADSSDALKPLESVPCSELETRAETMVSLWATRPERTAGMIIPKRCELGAAA